MACKDFITNKEHTGVSPTDSQLVTVTVGQVTAALTFCRKEKEKEEEGDTSETKAFVCLRRTPPVPQLSRLMSVSGGTLAADTLTSDL